MLALLFIYLVLSAQFESFRDPLMIMLTVPLSMAGALLALTLSFDETLISSFVAGDEMTLPLRLWAMMRVGFTPEINALVTLVLLVSIALALVSVSLLKPKGEAEED